MADQNPFGDEKFGPTSDFGKLMMAVFGDEFYGTRHRMKYGIPIKPPAPTRSTVYVPDGRKVVKVQPPDNLLLRALWNIGGVMAPSETTMRMPNMPTRSAEEEAAFQKMLAARRAQSAAEQATSTPFDSVPAPTIHPAQVIDPNIPNTDPGWVRQNFPTAGTVLSEPPAYTEAVSSAIRDALPPVAEIPSSPVQSISTANNVPLRSDFDLNTSAGRVSALRAMGVDWQTPSASLSANPEVQSVARQMMMTPRERAVEQMLNMKTDRDWQLRANPELADRIAAERQLTQRMQPMEVATANTSDARANQLLQSRGILKDNEIARANLASSPRVVPVDDAKFQEAIRKRQQARDIARQMITSRARGKAGLMTKQDVYNAMLMSSPGGMQALAQSALNGQDNAARMAIAQMQLQGDANQRAGWLQHDATQREADRLNRIKEAELRFAPGPGELNDMQKIELESAFRAIDAAALSPADREARKQEARIRVAGAGIRPGAPASTAPMPSSTSAPLIPDLKPQSLDDILSYLEGRPDADLTPELFRTVRDAYPTFMQPQTIDDAVWTTSRPTMWEAFGTQVGRNQGVGSIPPARLKRLKILAGLKG